MLTLMACAVGFSVLAPPARAQSNDPAAVLQAQFDAFEARDKEAWVGYYAPDVVITDVGLSSIAWIGQRSAALVYDLIASGNLEVTVTETTATGKTDTIDRMMNADL